MVSRSGPVVGRSGTVLPRSVQLPLAPSTVAATQSLRDWRPAMRSARVARTRPPEAVEPLQAAKTGDADGFGGCAVGPATTAGPSLNYFSRFNHSTVINVSDQQKLRYPARIPHSAYPGALEALPRERHAYYL